MLLGILNSQVDQGGGSAFELISTQVLASSASSVTFSSIPSDFKHLQIRMAHRNTRTGSGNGLMVLEFNGDTGANYSMHELVGNGSTVTSNATFAVDQNFMGLAFSPEASNTTSAFAGTVVDILDYSNTSKNKTVRSLGGVAASTNRISLISGHWRNTSAVTSINMYVFSGSLLTGSRFSLYGIRGE